MTAAVCCEIWKYLMTGKISNRKDQGRNREMMLYCLKRRHREITTETPGTDTCGEPWMPIPFGNPHDDDDL